MENKHIIGFAGRARSGKSQLAQFYKEEKGAKVIAVAKYLKELCAEILGVDIEELNRLKNTRQRITFNNCKNIVEIIVARTGISFADVEKSLNENLDKIKDVRDMLQIVGTNIIRKYKPSWHIDELTKEIKASEEEWIVIDDVRFPNERAAIEGIGLGGEVFFIMRQSQLNVMQHESETALKWQDFSLDHVIFNDYSIETMKKGMPYLNNGEDICYLHGEKDDPMVNSQVLKADEIFQSMCPLERSIWKSNTLNFSGNGSPLEWLRDLEDSIQKQYVQKFLMYNIEDIIYNPYIIESLKTIL